MNDIFLYHIQMRPAIKGVVLPDDNGDYTIYINNIYNAEQQREAFNHEVKHLICGHHQDERSLTAIEAEASKAILLKKIKEAEANGLPLHTAIMAKEKAPPVKAGPAYGTAEYWKLQSKKQLRGMLTGLYY